MMKRVWAVFRYMIREAAMPVAIYYIVIALLLAVGFSVQIAYNNVRIGFNGVKFATTVFLFVAGLNSFKSPYLFLQANGITRRCFIRSGTLALAAVAAGMTLIDAALNGFLGIIAPADGELPSLLYPNAGFAGTLVWTLAVNLLSAFAGWFVTMLYYRLSKTGKVALSLSPAVVFVALALLDPAMGVWRAIGTALRYAMGLAGTPNPYVGALTIAAAAAALAGFCFLLVRRAPVKEQTS